MLKSVLIVGKDFPNASCYVTSAIDSSRNVVVSKASQTEVGESNIDCVSWNRNSPISARNLIVRSEAKTGVLDEAIVIFDVNSYISSYSQFDLETVSKVDDEFIRGYFYVLTEILNRFVKKSKGHLVLVVRTLPDDGRNPIALQSAYASFVSLCENIYKEYSQSIVPKITLIKITTESDVEVSNWLFNYLDDIENLKDSNKKKKDVVWIKCGQKAKKGLLG